MLRTITGIDIDILLREARKAENKRANLFIHKPEEVLQRTLTALLSGTYLRPQKHDDVVLLTILRGTIAVLHFDELGKVEEIIKLEAQGDTKIVDIAPYTYYTLIPLESSIILQIIQGVAIEEGQRQFASWSPEESNAKMGDFLMYLTSIVENWKL
ncbi:MAG: WbuC family cupin fold metalloprotein [Anaerolineae bacterium]|nr:WbuC family cupin fold metalloprotein [Anaerolineae bacterium]MDQ7036184.1 WbuC family cupin fold metalloprotein [Anaerolineae bacterium]